MVENCEKKVKVFIHTDLEGVSSFYNWDEAKIDTSRGIGYTKEFLTQEINAAVEGIFNATEEAEVIVEDGHGGGYAGPNIIAEKLDKRAELLVGRFDRHLAVIDSSFDLLMMVGAHSMAGTKKGVMNHTLSSGTYYNIFLNEKKVGEIGLCTAIAGYFGVPLAMVSGDYWAVKEAKELTGDIEGASVKKGLNSFNARCHHPEKAREMIKKAAERAVNRKDDFLPYKIDSPIRVKMDYLYTHQADKAEIHKGAERVGGRSVLFEGDDLLAVFNKFLMG